MAGTLFVVATPIGNLEDISARALRILREVSLIAAEDTRHTGHLLQRFGLTTRTTSFHEHNEKGKAASLIARLLAGESIALVSDAGTPTVSDPGGRLIREAHASGIRVEPIPGPSAAIAALSVSGFEGSGFLFLGFPPINSSDRRAWFDRFRCAPQVCSAVIFYEAPHRVQATVAELREQFGNLELLVARELTKAHEEIRTGKLSELNFDSPRGEFTFVVDVGQLTAALTPPAPPSASEVAREFGEMTNKTGLTRRQAIAALSRKYRLQARQVFSLLEAAKPSAV
jgi:16S rRNA (cytidine1402-2'-O)-methyltransferase